MRRFVSAASLTLLLFACAAEKPAEPVAPAAPAAAAPAAADPVAPITHDVTGAYFPIDAWPAAFAELDHLSLATIDENANPAPLNGFLRPKVQSAKDYVLVEPALEEKRLTFVTTSVDGVQYAFDGEFQILAKFAENPPSYETVVLAGTLTQTRDGKTVASEPVRFRYEAGG